MKRMEKKMEFEKEERDILSSLPNDILSNIISYLPLKEAIRTSILSRRWAHSWLGSISITCLCIDLYSLNCFPYGHPSDPDWIEKVNKWINIVDSIFQSCQGSIRDCRFECCPPRFEADEQFLDDQTLDVMERLAFSYDRWAEILRRGGIERLVFRGHYEQYKFPSTILNCDSLRYLQLQRCQLVPISSFNGCRNLRILTLLDVDLRSHPIRDVISKCLNLERLDLLHCYGIEDITIHSQNLKYLYVRVDSWRYKIALDIDAPNLFAMVVDDDKEVNHFYVRAPNLHYCCVNMSTSPSEEIQKTIDWIYISAQTPKMNIFEPYSPSNKNILELHGRSIEVLAADNLSRCLPTPFNMIRKLSIQVNLKYQRHAYVVKVLLKRCPFMQEFSILLNDKGIKNTRYLEEPYPEYWDADEPFCCLDACLEEVWVSNFMAFDYEVEFAKFIMANARVLKRMSITRHSHCHYRIDDLTEVANDLISFQKASSNACINVKF